MVSDNVAAGSASPWAQIPYSVADGVDRRFWESELEMGVEPLLGKAQDRQLTGNRIDILSEVALEMKAV